MKYKEETSIMNTWRLLLLCLALTLACCQAQAYTLSFDDVSTGADGLSQYTDTYGIMFLPGFAVMDHSGTTWSWGHPNSGDNVLVWTGDSRYRARIEFGETQRYSIRSLGAFFSTDAGIVVKMTAYHTSTDNPVASITIGDTESSWDNHYVEISSEAGDIDFIDIDGIYSADSRLGFCADDMSIAPVPEPSSVVALVSGLASLVLWRRRARFL